MKEMNLKGNESLADLTTGELYLFHSSDKACTEEDALWGVFDRREENGRILLETMSCDLRHFEKWTLLPEGFCFGRLASRAELRDYVTNLTYAECTQHCE